MVLCHLINKKAGSNTHFLMRSHLVWRRGGHQASPIQDAPVYIWKLPKWDTMRSGFRIGLLGQIAAWTT
ncbi:MAG TPA: hypothetical protein DCE42_30680 [Myxococcales bacterium]|nr:hypothetical protein [Deltaproteobacteria bacterium]MBU47329.1 hypothetical protein [Deltaproteobacteria bacterium]HAA59154.1 hypothetical protein [Myxococcales bacterium]